MKSPKLSDILLWLGGTLALGVLVWLFIATAGRHQAPATPPSIVLVTSTHTPEVTASPTVENIWQLIVTPTPGGPLFEQPTVVYPTPLPVIYPAPRARSGFLYGGQVQDFNAPDKMKWAGMSWVKFQIREGDTDALDKVKRGHSSGFKVLLSAVGDPRRVEDETYYGQYAAYVAGLATGGADAIEIWNEPNIARDWQAGKISPGLYIRFLKQSYEAIKTANPDTLVISAAQAATLIAQNLRTPNVWTETDYT